ncbi:hypothetical protein JCM11641_008431 [Rhodosporidiobolus odoratus]
MVATQISAAVFFLTILATTWDDATDAIRLGGLFPPLFGRLHLIESWIVTFVNALLEAFWTWRACRITASRSLRGLACLTWFTSIGGFLGTSVLATQQYIGQEISFERSLWVTLVNALLCASIIGYELVWKRRESLLKSTLVSQFAQVALRTSLVAVIIDAIGAISITYSHVTGDGNGLLITYVCARIYQFASLDCILYSLNHRATIRLSTSVLPKGPNSLGNFSSSPLDALRPAPQQETHGKQGKRGTMGGVHQTHHFFSRFRPDEGSFPVSMTSSAERSLELNLDLEAGVQMSDRSTSRISLSPSTYMAIGKFPKRQQNEGVTVEIEVDVRDEVEQEEKATDDAGRESGHF